MVPKHSAEVGIIGETAECRDLAHGQCAGFQQLRRTLEPSLSHESLRRDSDRVGESPRKMELTCAGKICELAQSKRFGKVAFDVVGNPPDTSSR
jgi:hypothetical protein